LYVWGFLLFYGFFFKVKSGVFLQNRVATLLDRPGAEDKKMASLYTGNSKS